MWFIVHMHRFSEVVAEAVERSDKSAIKLAEDNGLKRDAIRSVLRGSSPSVDRAEEICAALGLEFYVGPPRGRSALPPPSREQPPPTPQHDLYPTLWLMELAVFFKELPEDCPWLEGRDCPLIAKLRACRRVR